MSKTVSFVARDELAEWLESQAEAEMKSVSAVCQDVVAAEYKRVKAGTDASDGGKDESGDGGGESGADAVLARHPEGGSASGEGRWYELDEEAKNNYAVFTQEKGYTDGKTPNRKYFKTKSGAAKALKKYWE